MQSFDRKVKFPPGTETALLREQTVNLLGCPSFSYSMHDRMSGSKFAWCLAVIYEGYLEVEEFFVKPGWDKKFACIELAKALVRERAHVGLPLCIWVSHCDATEGAYNKPVIDNVIAGFGFTPRKSTQRWAAALAK